MHGWNGDWSMGWMGTWWILGAALLAVVVWALVRAARTPTTGSSASPEGILKGRYAKGEIDQETYKRTSTDLKG